jgi:hypothetical protein
LAQLAQHACGAPFGPIHPLWLDDLMASLIRSIRPYSHHPVSKRLSQQAIAVGLQTTREAAR